MKYIDTHVHFDSTDPVKIDVLAETARRNETWLGLIAAVRMGEEFYPTFEETMAACRKYPDCFFPIAQVDLWDKVDVGSVYRFKDAGVKMLKCIYPYYEYDHDLYMPVYEAAEKCALPIIFHTGNYFPCPMDPIYRRPMLRNQAPDTLDRVCRSFQSLKIIMAHLGTANFRHAAAELVKNFPNLYADLAGSGAYMCISPFELQQLLRPYLQQIDPECGFYKKLILGSDAYVTYPQNVPEAIHWYKFLLDGVGVPVKVQQLVMGGTVAKWIGLPLD